MRAREFRVLTPRCSVHRKAAQVGRMVADRNRMPADGQSIMPAALQRARRVALGCLTAWLVACGGGGGVDPAAPAPSAAVTPGAVALDTTDLDPAAAAQLANDEPGESGAEAVPATPPAADDAGASTPEVETPSPTAPAPATDP